MLGTASGMMRGLELPAEEISVFRKRVMGAGNYSAACAVIEEYFPLDRDGDYKPRRNDMRLVLNIGCIECGVSSNVVGLFDTKEAADAVAEKLQKSHSWRECSQNSFEVFALPTLGVIAPEYAKPPID